jgi:hypothetical protein
MPHRCRTSFDPFAIQVSLFYDTHVRQVERFEDGGRN